VARLVGGARAWACDGVGRSAPAGGGQTRVSWTRSLGPGTTSSPAAVFLSAIARRFAAVGVLTQPVWPTARPPSGRRGVVERARCWPQQQTLGARPPGACSPA